MLRWVGDFLKSFLIYRGADCHPTIAHSSEGLTAKFNTRSQSCYIHGAEDTLPFSWYAIIHNAIASVGLTLHVVEQVPIDDYQLPLGQAEVLMKGSDLTVVTWGTPVYQCETALSLLSSPPPSIAHLVPESLRGASIELIDLRTILPWDVQTVVDSVNRTGRLVIVHEASRTAGAGAEIGAEVQKKCFLKLAAPVKRVAAWEWVLLSQSPYTMH